MMKNRMLFIVNSLVFSMATLVVAGVFYEGMVQKWFEVVGILILITDMLFVLSTVINIIFNKNKPIFNIVSIIMIVAAVVMKTLHIEYPAILMLIWFFYIWLSYGIIIMKNRSH